MPADSQYDVVHELTKGGELYGCHSRSGLSASYVAPDREYSGAEFVETHATIKHAMSDKCRNFYLWDSDRKCAGCTAPKDFDYAEYMGAME